MNRGRQTLARARRGETMHEGGMGECAQRCLMGAMRMIPAILIFAERGVQASSCFIDSVDRERGMKHQGD